MRVGRPRKLEPFYVPFERQQIFHSSPAKYRLFGGAAGPGKSRALLEEGVQQAAEHAGADVLILRRSYPELEKSIIEPMRRFILPFYGPQGAKFNEAKNILRLPNESNVYFGYCRTENDVHQYQGGEFLFIGIDELTHFTLKQWQFLTSRNRCPIPDTFSCMAGATNPGNIGHAWVKALFIDKKVPAGWDSSQQPYNPDEYEFIPARLDDNPIYANDTAYKSALAALPANLRKAMLEGDWNLAEGQYFIIFDRAKHVVGKDYCRFDSWIQRWLSIDWGFGHNAAMHWHARLENGQIFTYRELICSNLSPVQLATAIVTANHDEDLAAIYLSPDAFAKRESYITIADQMSDVFREAGFPMCSRADNDRVSGWSLMYDLMEGGQWIISETCENLIDSIPAATRDPDFKEDILKFDGDDSLDGCFVSGTEVTTIFGNKPIEEIQIGDLVLTRNGWQRVEKSWLTRKNAEVMELVLDDGRKIVGTPNHPIWVDNGWSRLDSIRYGDNIESWPTQLPLTELSSDAIQIQKTEPIGNTTWPAGMFAASGYCTAGFGLSRMARFQKAITSITEMAIHSITVLKILRVFPARFIRKCTSILGSQRKYLSGFGHSPLSGTHPEMALSGIKNTPLSFAIASGFPLVANTANLNSWDFPINPDSVPISANRHGEGLLDWISSKFSASAAEKPSSAIGMMPCGFARVIAVNRLIGKHDVFNLEVANDHEYFANGILVHNCRYGLKSHIRGCHIPIAERVARQLFSTEERAAMALPVPQFPVDMTHRMRYLLELQKKESRVASSPIPIKRFKHGVHRQLSWSG